MLKDTSDGDDGIYILLMIWKREERARKGEGERKEKMIG